MTLLEVVLGAFLGAPVRYLTDLLVRSRYDGAFPWGTLTVNIAGSAILGAVAGYVTTAGGPHWLLAAVGTGFCGALTTFSTFSFETVRLIEEGTLGAAALNVGLSVALGAGACFAGWGIVVAW